MDLWCLKIICFVLGFFPQDWKRTKSRCHVASPTWLLLLGGEWKMAGVEEGTKCNQSAAKVPEIKGLESSRQNHMLFNTRTQLPQQNLQLLPKLLPEWKGSWLQKLFELNHDSEKDISSCESFSHHHSAMPKSTAPHQAVKSVKWWSSAFPTSAQRSVGNKTGEGYHHKLLHFFSLLRHNGNSCFPNPSDKRATEASNTWDWTNQPAYCLVLHVKGLLQKLK